MLQLSVTDAPPAGRRLVVRYEGHDTGGNTSVAHDRADSYKWSGESPFPRGGWGYFTPAGVEVAYVKRDRDLGQTFRYTGEQPARLDAVTLRTGFGTNVVRPRAYGERVSLQLFRVTGAPVVHDNGTSGTTEALHGFPHDRAGQAIPAERDDYVVGETYVHLAHASGGRFPSRAAFGLDEAAEVDPNDPRLKGRYLRFDLRGEAEIVLEPGATYAFLVLIDEAGDDRGFTLANHYTGSYADGHAIRRDGNGTFPPAPADPSRPFGDPANAAALAAAHFPGEMAERLAIPPGTNGYPDVDTWRDLSFWVEAGPGRSTGAAVTSTPRP